jgi:ribonucleoside-triphosphate reductase (formate)
MDASQEFSGAIAIGDLIVNYCYYAKKENLSDSDIKNHLQRLVHIVNNKFRIASQSPFTNISIFDKINLNKLFSSYIYPDGSTPDFDYIMRIQKLFCEWFALGDPSTGMPYRFPIVTINLHTTNGIINDTEFLDWVSKVNCNTGCYNLYINSGNKISSCCRLLNNLDDMPRIDTFGNGSIGSIGSIRVVTLNLPRIALKANGNKEKFFVELHTQLCNARDLLQVQREDIIYRRISSGFLKFFEPMRWLNIKRYFSTFGIIGVFEANEFMHLNIQSEEGIAFTSEVLQFIEAFAKKTGKELGYPMNVEEIPGESVATKFVQKDRVLFGEDKVPFELYSNQYIPLIADVSLPERIELTGKFMEILSGGGILHLNLKDRITDPNVMRHLIEYSVSKNTTHVSVNYSFGECEDGHVTVCGNSETCPICGKKIISHVTRIVGYFTKTSSWGKARREYEFPRRIFS